MRNHLAGSLSVALLAGVLTAQAQVTISPLTTFGGGDGWLSPGEGNYTYLGTGNLERGLAYGNGHLYLVSRNGGSFIRILDSQTGADLGALDTTGISGGTFAVDMIAVARDGAIFVGNLTTSTTTSPFKVYKWATESGTPVVAYSGDAGLAGSRVGDSLAAIGSGSSTLLAAGYGSSPAVTGNNGYVVINPTAGTASAIAFSGTPPNAGDFRLGITFADAGHVLGAQSGSAPRYTSFSGAAGTLLSSLTLNSAAEVLLSYNVLGGRALLAAQSYGDSHVSLYDVTDPANPVSLIATPGNNTSGTLAPNGNGTGELAWGAVTDHADGTVSQTLYAMSSNQGIQAFIITVPEPGVLTLTGLGLALVLWRRRAQRG